MPVNIVTIFPYMHECVVYNMHMQFMQKVANFLLCTN